MHAAVTASKVGADRDNIRFSGRKYIARKTWIRNVSCGFIISNRTDKRSLSRIYCNWKNTVDMKWIGIER